MKKRPSAIQNSERANETPSLPGEALGNTMPHIFSLHPNLLTQAWANYGPRGHIWPGKLEEIILRVSHILERILPTSHKVSPPLS